MRKTERVFVRQRPRRHKKSSRNSENTPSLTARYAPKHDHTVVFFTEEATEKKDG
jgi:hypothetical protein